MKLFVLISFIATLACLSAPNSARASATALPESIELMLQNLEQTSPQLKNFVQEERGRLTQVYSTLRMHKENASAIQSTEKTDQHYIWMIADNLALYREKMAELGEKFKELKSEQIKLLRVIETANTGGSASPFRVDGRIDVAGAELAQVNEQMLGILEEALLLPHLFGIREVRARLMDKETKTILKSVYAGLAMLAALQGLGIAIEHAGYIRYAATRAALTIGAILLTLIVKQKWLEKNVLPKLKQDILRDTMEEEQSKVYSAFSLAANQGLPFFSYHMEQIASCQALLTANAPKPRYEELPQSEALEEEPIESEPLRRLRR